MTKSMNKVPKILVVDDQPVNVRVLEKMLLREGMEVLTAGSGEECLKIVQRDKPDVILLDVMMPGMDGIEVCQRLKKSEDSKGIPVIIISARTSKEGRLAGLESGAVDYITKPIDLDETMARIRTQLRFLEIHRQNTELQKRLEESRRVATIGAITRGLAHNLNNLLGVTVGYVDLIQTFHNQPDLVRKNSEKLEKAIMRIVDMVKKISGMAVDSQLPLSPISLVQLLRNAVQRFQHDFQLNHVVEIEVPEDSMINTNPEVMESAISKILINAWESYGEDFNGNRRIILRGLLENNNGKQQVKITIDDFGKGIDPALRDNVFEPFTSSKQTVGTGLGLTVARHSLRNLSGVLALEDRPGGGTRAVLAHEC